MIQRRAKSAGTRVGNHTFRATGVTAYLKNGGTLEKAAQMANHASTCMTQLYDRRAEEVTLDEVERVMICETELTSRRLPTPPQPKRTRRLRNSSASRSDGATHRKRRACRPRRDR
jgi:hypothetical protein